MNFEIRPSSGKTPITITKPFCSGPQLDSNGRMRSTNIISPEASQLLDAAILECEDRTLTARMFQSVVLRVLREMTGTTDAHD